MTLIDVLRLITVSAATFTALVAIFIAYRYQGIWRQTRSTDRLLPQHVVLIAVREVLLSIAIAGMMVERMGQDFIWWATPIVLPSSVLGIFALSAVVRFIIKRQTRFEERQRVALETVKKMLREHLDEDRAD